MYQKVFAFFLFWCGLSVCFAVVNVNTAQFQELQTIKGIGPAKAQAILVEREKGDFQDANDLAQRVSGLGNKSVQKMVESGLLIEPANVSVAQSKPNVAQEKPSVAQSTKLDVTQSKPNIAQEKVVKVIHDSKKPLILLKK